MGRPSKYNAKITNEICERMIAGESLNQICRSDGMPDKSTVFRWLEAHEPFRDNYARAREMLVDSFADEILEISDDGSNDWAARESGDDEEDSGGMFINHEHINRSRLRVDTRKWLMSKLLPKKYGDASKVELTGKDGAAIVPVINISAKN